MNDRQLQIQEVPLSQRTRTRGLISQISAVLLQPVYFFRTMPTMGETRQWLWIAILILGILGMSAVRQQQAAPVDTSGGGDLGGLDMGMGGDFGGMPGDFGGLDMGMGGDFGGMPTIPGGGGGTSTEPSVNDTLTTAIVTASGMVLGWLILTVLLSEVTLFKGQSPKLGQNFQIAIWASLPLALMAIAQLLYAAAGGVMGRAGISGLVLDWAGFAEQSEFVQLLLLSLTSVLTLFWLWQLMLIYYGARHALNGRRWTSVLVVVLWIAVSVVIPVATGAIKLPEPAPAGDDFGEFGGFDDFGDFGGEMPFNEGEFEGDMGGNFEEPPLSEESSLSDEMPPLDDGELSEDASFDEDSLDGEPVDPIETEEAA